VGRRARKRAQTRAALLHAAGMLFAERGIHATRVADITDEIDLGKGAFYNYFESKDALVTELVAEGLGILEEQYLARLDPDDDASARVGRVVRLHADFFDEHPHFALLLDQARGLLQLGAIRIDRLREVFSRYLERVGVLLRPPGDETRFSREELLDIAAVIGGSVAGYRSFRMSVGLAPTVGTLAVTLVDGLPRLFERR
jgi:AcrR family transcriptional regulator